MLTNEQERAVQRIAFTLQTVWHLRAQPASDFHGVRVWSDDGRHVLGTVNSQGVDLVEDGHLGTLIDWSE